ncbi:MAG TPA: ATP-dependent RecD-like DNA helicase [Enterococcus columbae]|nr:ATP-dependent RecD-like DNA helicase [Enterococcus columbae]
METKAEITGSVQAIFFENQRNFYKVMLIKIQQTNLPIKEKEIVVTGSFGQIQEGEVYQFFGQLVNHPKYGQQFQVESYQQAQPTSFNGLVTYFSSDRFPGIGRKTAEKIVETLGENAIEQILADATVLKEIPSLNEKKRQMIVNTILANHGMDQVIVGLSKYGFGSQLSFAIYQKYKNDALNVIENNPYQLVEDIEGIGFKRADHLASQLEIAADSPKRLRAAILHQILQQSLEQGDTYVQAQDLMEQTLRLLEDSRPIEILPEQLAQVIIELVEEGAISQDEMRLYENSLFFAEYGIANSITRLLSRKKEIQYPIEKIEKAIRKVEKRLGIQYGASQISAIKAAIQSPLFILTGGPGTGKTTVVNGIVQVFAELNDLDLQVHKYTETTFPILLAAPTGRAAKRMNETTGLPSGTIHRLLGLNGKEKKPLVDVRELEGGLLIVDEMSMVDTWLANMLFKAIGNQMQVILVGDKDQLPSVGPGQVLHDLLAIEELASHELNEIYRQGEGSSIIPLAHEIKVGQLPNDLLLKKADRSFIACQANQIEEAIAQIVKRAKAKGFTAQDIQVLAPMYRGIAGIDALNQMMQSIFNPPQPNKKEVYFNEVCYRIGDKVLQLVNATELNVFNGDMGVIVGINYAKDTEDKVDELIIQFDSQEVTYPRNEWQQITLAYCCSIHKSQGSEFKMVILPMVRQYSRMLQRNLLYTAVTRSKEILILLGEVQAFVSCVQNEAANRLTTLDKRIRECDELSDWMRLKIDQYETAQLADEVEETSIHSTDTKAIITPKQSRDNQALDSKQLASQDRELFKEAQSINNLAETKSEKESIINYDLFVDAKEDKNTQLSETVTTLPDYLTINMIEEKLIDPMIGMNDLSPYDFM